VTKVFQNNKEVKMKQKVKCNDKSFSQIQKDVFKLEKTAKPLKIESGHESKK